MTIKGTISVLPNLVNNFSRQPIRQFSGLIVAALALIATPTLAQTSVSGLAPSDFYQDCVDLVGSDPNQAFDMAEDWQTRGGGAPALHCAALALINLGHYGAAAEKLETLAATPGIGDDSMKAEVLIQAGNSWLMADAPSHAIRLLSNALTLKPQDAALLTDRARAYGLLEDWQNAQGDLSAALALDPEYTPAYIFRASARRKLGLYERAMEDIELAIALNAEAPDAFLERGLLHVEEGDRDAARQDWLTAIALADAVDQSYADTARSYLEALDVSTSE